MNRDFMLNKVAEFDQFVYKNKILKLKRILIDVKIDFQEDINHEKSEINFLENVLYSLKEFNCGVKRCISRSRTKKKV